MLHWKSFHRKERSTGSKDRICAQKWNTIQMKTAETPSVFGHEIQFNAIKTTKQNTIFISSTCAFFALDSTPNENIKVSFACVRRNWKELIKKSDEEKHRQTGSEQRMMWMKMLNFWQRQTFFHSRRVFLRGDLRAFLHFIFSKYLHYYYLYVDILYSYFVYSTVHASVVPSGRARCLCHSMKPATK